MIFREKLDFIQLFLVKIYENGIIKIPNDQKKLNEFISILDNIIKKIPVGRYNCNTIPSLFNVRNAKGDYIYFEEVLQKTINDTRLYSRKKDREYRYLDVINEDFFNYIKKCKNTYLGIFEVYMEDICNMFTDEIKNSPIISEIYDSAYDRRLNKENVSSKKDESIFSNNDFFKLFLAKLVLKEVYFIDRFKITSELVQYKNDENLRILFEDISLLFKSSHFECVDLEEAIVNAYKIGLLSFLPINSIINMRLILISKEEAKEIVNQYGREYIEAMDILVKSYCDKERTNNSNSYFSDLELAIEQFKSYIEDDNLSSHNLMNENPITDEQLIEQYKEIVLK